MHDNAIAYVFARLGLACPIEIKNWLYNSKDYIRIEGKKSQKFFSNLALCRAWIWRPYEGGLEGLGPNPKV